MNHIISKTKKTLIFGLSLLLCIACLAVMSGCSDTEGEVGNVLDRTLWTMGGFPSQAEILEHLQEKYDEDFALLALNSGARNFQGTAFPVSNPDMIFNLEMTDEEGNPLAIEDVRDDYQARLLEQMLLPSIESAFIDEFGSNELADLRIDVGFFGTSPSDNEVLPESFEWSPTDGIAALSNQSELSIQLTLRAALENQSVLNSLTVADLEGLAQNIVYDQGVALTASVIVKALDAPDNQVPLELTWIIEDGTIVDFLDNVLGQ